MFKRVLSLMLCLCILMSNMPTWSIALAEEELIVEEIVISETEPEPESEPEPEPEPEREPDPEPDPEPEPEAPKVKEETADTEEAAVETAAEEESKEPEEEPEVIEIPVAAEQPRFVNGYVSIDEGVSVYADADLSEKLGVFGEDAVAYVSDRENTEEEDQDILTLRFACGGELANAYVMAKDVTPLTTEEREAYIAQAADGVAYKSGVNLLSVEFLMEEEQTDGLEEIPAAEEDTEPVEEATAGEAEPAVEPESESEADELLTDENEATASEAEETEATASEPETEATVTDSEDDVCAEEDAPEEICTHSEKQMIETAVYESVAGFDDETHHGLADVTVLTYCKDCGESFGQEVLLDVEYTEQHIYENRVCKVCGYNACKHENVQTYDEIEWIDGPELKDNDCTKHVGVAEVITYTVCADCGIELGVGEAQVVNAYEEAHHFEDGEQACDSCGVAFCAHEGLENTVFLYEKIGVAQSEEDASKHIVTKKEYAYAECAKCGGYIKNSTGNTVTENVTHEYINGVCECGAQSACQHENKIAEVYYELVGELAADEDGLTHTGVYDEYVEYICPDCNEEFKPELTADDVVKTFEHEYLDGVCWECGYEQQEESAPEVPEVMPEAESTPSEPEEEIEPEIEATPSEPEEEIEPEIEATPSEPEMIPEAEATMSEPEAPVVVATPDEPHMDDGQTEPEEQDNSMLAPTSFTVRHTSTNGKITLSWTSEVQAESYNVYEIVDGVEKSKKSSTTLSASLTGVSMGEHTYIVKPRKKVDGAWVYGEASQKVTLNVKKQDWRKAPTISSASQVTTDEGMVKLSWKPVSAAESYWIYEGGKNEENLVATANTTSATITGVAVGTRKYYVRPVQMDSNGLMDLGSFSEVKSVSVSALWKKKPTISAVKQMTDAEGKIQLTWKAGWAGQTAFGIFIDGADKPTMIIEDGATQAIVEGVPSGTRKFVVKPAKMNEDGETWSYGSSSSSKSLSVSLLWKKKPTGLKAVQLKDEAEGQVKLTWKSGSEFSVTQEFQIRDKVDGKTSTVEENEEIRIEWLPYDEETELYGAVISGVSAGAHEYSVRPLYDGKTGTSSATAKLTVSELWKTKPTIASAAQVDYTDKLGVVEITWKDKCPYGNTWGTEGFQIRDKFSGKTSTLKQGTDYESIEYADGVYSVTITTAKTGDHEYSVRPYNPEKNKTGSSSSTKKVTVKAVTWKTKPTLTVAQATDAENTVNLTWDQMIPAEAFIIYEVVDGKDKAIFGSEQDPDTYVYDMECSIEEAKEGTHNYRVRPVQIDSDGEITLGSKSDKKSVTVKTWWKQKPTSVKAEASKTAEETVTLTWKSGSDIGLTKEFQIRDGITGSNVVVDEGNIEWHGYNAETGRYSATLTNQVAGTHKYSVRPWDPDTEKAGTSSSTVSLKVETLWKKKPTSVKAVQMPEDEGVVKLTWKSGSEPEATLGFQIRDKVNGSTTTAETIDTPDYDPETKLYSTVLYGVAAGTHEYSVRPYNPETEKNGSTSSTVSLKVETLWKKKPTSIAVTQAEDVEKRLNVSWTPGWEYAEDHDIAYAVYVDSKIYKVNGEEVIFEGTEATLDNVATGTRKITVKAAKYDEAAEKWTYGSTSSSKSISVKTLWKNAPTITSAVQTANGEVTVTWKTGSVLSSEFALYYKKSDKTTNVIKAADFAAMVENGEIICEEIDGVMHYTAVLKGLGTGTYEFTAKSSSVSESGTRSYGTASSAVKVSVKSGAWNQAPTLTAQATGYGEVTLNWKQLEPATYYAIYEADENGLIDTSAEMLVSGSSYVIKGLEAGKHTFAVRPVLEEIEEETGVAYLQYGTISKMVSVTVEGVDAAKVTGLTATYDDKYVTLVWNPVKYAAGYNVYMDGEANPINTELCTEATFITGRQGSEASYYVEPVLENGETGIASDLIQVVFGAAASDLAAQFGFDLGGVKLTWNGAAVSYDVYRAAGDGEFAKIKTGVTASYYVDTNIEADATYTYKIVAIYENGYTSSDKTATAQIAKLAAPQNVTVTYDGTEHTVVWDQVEGAENYEVYRIVNDGTEVYVEPTKELTISDFASDLNAKYTYKVYAKKVIGSTTFTSVAGVSNTIEHEAAPASFSATYDAASASVILTWEKPVSENLTGYSLTNTKTGVTTMLGTDVTQFPDSSVRLGGSYSYSLKAVYGNNTSVETTTSIMLSALGQVKNLDLQFFTTSVNLRWDAVQNAQKYEISRSVNGGDYEVVATVAANEWSDTDVQINTKYMYKVQAVVEYADGKLAGLASSAATADIGEPAVLNARHSIKDGGVELTWNKSAKSDVVNYTIFRKDGAEAGGSFKPVGSVDAKKTRYVDTTVEMDKTYTYMLVVAREFGDDGPSNNVVVTVEPFQAVSNATYTYEDEKLTLTWDLVSGADYYDIIRDHEFIGDTWYDPFQPLLNTFVDDTAEDLTATYVYEITSVLVSNEMDENGRPLFKEYGNPPFKVEVTRGPKPVVATPVLAQGGVSVSWNAVESDKLTGYKVVRGDGSVVAEVGTDVNSVIDQDAETGDKVTYKVIAVYTDGTMSTTLAPFTVPAYVIDTTENEDGTVTLGGVLGTPDEELVIPATINGKTVSAIAPDAFKGNTTIETVTIEAPVTEIPDGAFEGCTSLTSVVLPNSVEVIGVRAFADCTNLSSMTCID